MWHHVAIDPIRTRRRKRLRDGYVTLACVPMSIVHSAGHVRVAFHDTPVISPRFPVSICPYHMHHVAGGEFCESDVLSPDVASRFYMARRSCVTPDASRVNTRRCCAHESVSECDERVGGVGICLLGRGEAGLRNELGAARGRFSDDSPATWAIDRVPSSQTLPHTGFSFP